MSWIKNDNQMNAARFPIVKKGPSVRGLPKVPPLDLSKSSDSLDEKKKKSLMSPRHVLHTQIKKEEAIFTGIIILPAAQGMSLLLKTIDRKHVLELDAWKEKLFEKVVAKTKKASTTLTMTHRNRTIPDKAVKKIVKKVLSKSLEFSGILQRIKEAVSIFGSISIYDYLQTFLKSRNPKNFWKCYEALPDENETFSSKQSEYPIESRKKIFYQIMGGEKALTILAEAAKVRKRKVLKKECFFQADCYIEVTKKIRLLVEKTFIFLEGFDFRGGHGVNPIYLIDGKDIIENYRAFWGGDVFSNTCFKFNGVSYPLPNFKEEEKGSHRSILFIRWIMEHLQESIGVKSDYSVEEQSVLLSDTNLPPINRLYFIKTIAACLSESYKGMVTDEDCIPRFFHFHTLLKKQLNDEGFCNLLAEHSEYVAYSIVDYLEQENNDYSKTAESLLIFVYPRIFLYDKQKTHIPMRSILTAMTASCAFGKVDTFLREDLCPKLCNDAIGAYYLKYFPGKTITKFAMDIKENKAFVVKISRIFKVCEVTDTKDHIPKMKFEVIWQISGQLESPKYTARLKIIPHSIKKPVLMDIQRKIMDCFNLELKNTHWGHYFEMH